MKSVLPPGQIETKRFPVVGERAPSGALDADHWTMTIVGEVIEPRRLDLHEYLALDHRTFTFDIHCVTSWTRFGSTFTGIPLREVVTANDDARYVSFGAYSDRGHHTSLPLGIAMEQSWLVHEFEGAPLTVEHGGPVRVVTPGRYFYKSLKWLRTIEFLREDRLGWWEVNSSYHNNADPGSGEERFTTGSLRPEQLSRFVGAPNYDKYRNRVMLGLDLTSWQPASRDLRRLYLKHCDISGVVFGDVDLRNSNLSLSDLSGADLRGSDLSGSDLEGANFSGADLSGADLRDTALSATRFDGAIVAGARFDGSWGLVESQRDYLVGQGLKL